MHCGRTSASDRVFDNTSPDNKAHCQSSIRHCENTLPYSIFKHFIVNFYTILISSKISKS